MQSAGMELREFGKTGIMVTPIGLGVMELGGGGKKLGFMFPVIAQETKDAIIKAALDGGINFFDTAEIYGDGVSERSLVSGLKAAGMSDKDVIIATKWFPLFRNAGNIARTIQTRIHNLDGYSISNYMVHQPVGFSTPEAEMDAMAALVKAGKVKSVGVSNFSPLRMRRAHAQLAKHGLPLACNQVYYSLLNRKIEFNGTLETAKELGITITAYTPLERGLLSGRFHKDPALVGMLKGWKKAFIGANLERTRPLVNAMDRMAGTHNATIAQVALNWLVNFHGETVVTIPGASKVYQAEEAAGAMKFSLTRDEMNELDTLTRK